jgi:serine/threonine protein kinase
MLTLTISTKKEADHYDRRKKVGTTRVSDVWSLGCLLFEILSGEHLFHNPDWVQFYIRVTSINETLITEDKVQQMGASIYLLDFLKYILVRD